MNYFYLEGRRVDFKILVNITADTNNKLTVNDTKAAFIRLSRDPEIA